MEGPQLASCISKPCSVPSGSKNVIFQFYFTGEVLQNGVSKADWSKEQREFYKDAKKFMIIDCDFQCKAGDQDVFPLIDGAVTIDEGAFEVRYKNDPDNSVWDKNSWYVAPEQTSSIDWQKSLADKDFARNVKES